MTNKDVIKALKDIKTYCAASSLDELEYAIKVMESLEKAGIENPLDKVWLKKISEKKDV